MEDVFVMTNDVEMRGVSLSTRKYHDIPIKKNIPKKLTFKIFREQFVKKIRNMRGVAKRRNE